MMFLETPEEIANCLNCAEGIEDIFGVGEITAEDITSILKIIYGKRYEEMKAIADKDREEIEQKPQKEKEKGVRK